jgi:glycosyltransferase involved in cell wall biosynthesis
MTRVGVAHPGTQHSWQTALAFQEADALEWYATSFYYKPDSWPDKGASFLPGPLRAAAERQLRRRHLPALRQDLVRRRLETEFLERPIGRFLSKRAMLRLQAGRHARFPGRLIRLAGREPVDVLWAPMDCVAAFEHLKPKGVVCVLDQPIGHYAALNETMAREKLRHPAFFGAKQLGVPDWLLSRQRRAAEVADLIVVGSEFAAQTMVDHRVAPSKIRVVPYGYDESAFPAERPYRTPIRGRPIEFLFVGTVGARKGLAYLLDAFKDVDRSKARLTIVGPLDMPATTFERYAGVARYVGQVTRSEVIDHMSKADCLILPSLFEGGGIVLYEAAACGAAIVQTAACGDGVRRAANGIILADLDAGALGDVIADLAAAPGKVERWGDASWAMREERRWAVYRAKVRALLEAEGLLAMEPSPETESDSLFPAVG